MKDNPYSKIIEIMQKQGSTSNPPSIQIGEVISPPPNLIVKINDLQIDKDNILIADYLLKDHMREVRTDTMTNVPSKQYETGRTTISGGSLGHDHNIVELTLHNTKMYTDDTLKVGDLLAVMPVYDRQLYLILARLKEVE